MSSENELPDFVLVPAPLAPPKRVPKSVTPQRVPRVPGGGGAPLPHPQPLPQSVPAGVAIIKIITDFESTKVCPPSQDHEAVKCYPETGVLRKGRKRRHPCGGQSPIVSYVERRRFVGACLVPPRWGWQSMNLRSIPEVEERLDEIYPDCKAGEEGSKVVVRFVYMGKGFDSLSDKGKKWMKDNHPLETILKSGAPGGVFGSYCAYEIFEIGKRRKCQCPDGSPCRKAKMEN